MKRILIANIFGIGDVIFTTPLILNLKEAIDGVTVDYLCNARTKDVAACVPDIDRVFVYEKDDLVKLWRVSRITCIRTLYRLFTGIRRAKYDAVFDLTFSRKFGFFFLLAGIRRRIGLDYKKRGTFLTDRIPLEGFEGRHVIEYYLDLAGRINVPVAVKETQLVPEEADLEWASGYLKEKGAGGGKIAAVIPGGGASWGGHASRKRWHPEGFSRAADILSGHGVRIALLGDPSETELCEGIARAMKNEPAILENGLTLKRYIALLDKCDLVLCNDGGPLHIAVALGIKTVSVFGPVSEKVYGPFPVSDRHRVITAPEASCRPCYNRFKLPECGNDNICVTGIDPETVGRACIELLGI